MRILGYIALLAWLVLGWKYWMDYKQCTPTKVIPVATADKECPLCFKWSSPSAVICDNWTSYRDSLLSVAGDDNKLRITGLFNSDESTDEELGRNRAVSIKALLNGYFPEENIIIDVEEINDSIYTSCKSRARLDVLKDGKVLQSNSLAAAVFYLNNNEFEDAESLMAHIEDMAIKAKDSDDKIRIIGHTDSRGSQKENIIRGYNYADQMKSYFIDKGVSREQLITISKGDNEQTSNEQSSNRVEVTITKS